MHSNNELNSISTSFKNNKSNDGESSGAAYSSTISFGSYGSTNEGALRSRRANSEERKSSQNS